MILPGELVVETGPPGLFVHAAWLHSTALCLAVTLAGAALGWLLTSVIATRVRLPGRFWKAFPALLFFLGFGLAFASSAFFDFLPRITDEAAYLFTARCFSEGMWFQPLADFPEAFRTYGVIGAEEGLEHRVGMYPPSWSVPLAIGLWLGVPGVINPICHGLLALATFFLGRAAMGERAGRWAGGLTAVSPFLFLLGGTYLSHTWTALMAVLCAWGTLRLVQTGEVRWGVLAGGALAVGFFARPVDLLVVGVVSALIPLVHIRSLGRFWKGAVLAAVIACLGPVFLLLWQQAAYGDFQQTGHSLAMDEESLYGLGLEDPRGAVFTMEHAVVQGIERFAQFNGRVLGFPGLTLLLPLLGLILFRRKGGRWMILWSLLPTVALGAFFFFYFYYEIFYPGRYLATAAPFFLLAVGAGFSGLMSRWPRIGGAMLGAGVLFAMVVAVPAAFSPFQATAYGDHTRQLERVQEKVDLETGNPVVFFASPLRKTNSEVIYDRNPIQQEFFCAYTTRWLLWNPMDYRSGPLFVNNKYEWFLSKSKWVKEDGVRLVRQEGLARNLAFLRNLEDLGERPIYSVLFHRDTYAVEVFRMEVNEDVTAFTVMEKIADIPGDG